MLALSHSNYRVSIGILTRNSPCGLSSPRRYNIRWCNGEMFPCFLSHAGTFVVAWLFCGGRWRTFPQPSPRLPVLHLNDKKRQSMHGKDTKHFWVIYPVDSSSTKRSSVEALVGLRSGGSEIFFDLIAGGGEIG